MKLFTLFIPLLFFTLTSLAQTTITGRTKDPKGRPVAGVSISIKDSYDGGTSDSTGKFSFKTTETGDKLLLASSIGFTPSEQTITLTGSLLTLTITLKEEPNELNAVSITAGTFEASDSKRTTVLNPIDIVTTASANGDVTGAIKTLPGAQQVGESEGLFVRGGTAGETKVFIDGTLVNNFFFSSVPDIAQRGRFSPFLFKGTIFSSGGYSAQYGQALSSVLLLESIDLPEQTTANIGITSVGLGGGYQRLAKDKKSSWGITYNYTNLLPSFKAIRQKPDYFRIPEFHNSDFNYRLKTSSTGMLKFYGYFNNSRLGLRRSDIDSVVLKDAFGLQNLNFYSNLSWKEKLGHHWKMNLGMSYSTNTDKLTNELQNGLNSKQSIGRYPFSQKNFFIRSNGQLATVKAVFERRLKGISMFRVGGEYFYNKDKTDYSADSISHSINQAADHLKAAFAETDIYVTNDLAAKIGTRVEHSALLGKANWAPRLSLAYKLGGAGQASLAYGIFYQKPENSFFVRNYRFDNLGYTRATHYIANFQKVSRDYTLRTEVFYKKYEDLIKTVYVSNNNTLLNNKGYGYAKGFELFWRDRKTIKNLDYWISYSYLDTRRDYLNYPASIQPNFAARHTASLVVKKFITALKTQFNGSYTFATGRPYYNIQYDYGKTQYRIFDQGKTRSYNNVGFSVNYLPNLNKPGASKFAVWVFSVSNVLGNKQVFGYNYSYKGVKEAVVPPANRFIFIGCFLSFGVDRSEDVINNNL